MILVLVHRGMTGCSCHPPCLCIIASVDAPKRRSSLRRPRNQTIQLRIEHKTRTGSFLLIVRTGWIFTAHVGTLERV